MTRFRVGACRTVRNNEVRIYGKTYHCTEPLDGQLNDKRFFFMRYSNTNPPLAALWGTEVLRRALGTNDMNRQFGEDEKILAPDGYYRWYFWQAAKEKP